MITKKQSEVDWQIVARESLKALRLLNAHYDDLGKSNPGFIGKMCLQHYDLWNEALMATSRVITKYKEIKI